MDIQYFQGWKIEKSIGVGAYGKVYKITRDVFGYTEEAALKVIDIPKSQSEVDPFKNEGMTDENVTTYFQEMVEKIVEEFVLMSRLKGNSNIVSYEDHFVEEKKDEFGWRIYIRMELLTPLFTYVKEHGMSEQDVIKLGIDVCKALELCKKNNIIHRDIKPENIFISSAGDFKLGDFGIARELEKTAAGLSKVGTLNYMAPEVNKGYEYNSTVDIYSLGIVLYRFLNENRLPFMPPAPQPIKFSDQDLAITMRMSGQQMPKPSKASEELSSIVLKACAYLPEDRYPLARDMRKDLEKLKKDNSEDDIILNIDQSTAIKSGTKGKKKEESKKEESIQKEDVIEENDIDNRTMMLFDSVKSSVDKKGDDNLSNKPADNADYSESKESGKGENIGNEEKSVIEKNDIKQEKIKQKKKVPKKIIVIVSIALLTAFGVIILMNYGNAGRKSAVGVSTSAPINNSIEKNIKEPTATPIEKVLVPDLSDMTKKELESKLKEYKLLFAYSDRKYSDTVKNGKVISQSPVSDTEVEIGSKITIVLSKGSEKVSVPSLKGISQKKAELKLKKAGLKCAVRRRYNSSMQEGYVFAQSVKPKSKVKKGKKIILYVSKGVEPVKATEQPAETDDNDYTPTQRPVATRRPVATKKPSQEKIDGTFKDDKKEKIDGTFR